MTKQEKFSLHLAYELIMSTKYGNLRFDRLDLHGRYSVWALDRSKFKGSKYIVDEVNSKNLGECLGRGFTFKQAKLYLRSFDQLTKTITQKDYNDGKPFVPIEELIKNFSGFWFVYNGDSLIFKSKNTNLYISTNWITEINSFLLKWHFAIGFEQGEYIEVTEENNPY